MLKNNMYANMLKKKMTLAIVMLMAGIFIINKSECLILERWGKMVTMRIFH